MGQASSTSDNQDDDLAMAFAHNGCKLERVVRFGQGRGAVATSPAMDYVQPHYDAELAARRILQRRGNAKRVYYVQGSHYEMGYLMGVLAPEAVHDMVTKYLNHMAPQFVGENFDVAMQAAPLMYQTVYEMLLELLTELMVEGSFKYFEAAQARGDIPGWCLDEMRGLVDGCKATNLSSPVTWKRVVAANYGIDYLMMLIFSGRIVRYAQMAWARLPSDIQQKIPFRAEMIVTPDMCNAFMVRGTATPTGEPYLLRDFQFNNAQVFHRVATLIVRDAPHALHIDVTAPGLLGCVTYLNQYGLCGGVNMVRSGAVDPDNLGLGCMLTMRMLGEFASTTTEARQLLQDIPKGCPWIFYTLDRTGDMAVFETVAAIWTPERLTPEQWVALPALLQDLQSRSWPAIPADQGRGGVWVRQPTLPTVDDATRREWSRVSFHTLGHSELHQPERWAEDGFLYPAWQDEVRDIKTVANFYFPPTRFLQDVLVVNNSFHNLWPRLSQMNRIATFTERVGTANQWRYDSLVEQLRRYHGQLTLERCRDILSFLSPWKQPHFPQNANAARLGIPELQASLSMNNTTNQQVTTALAPGVVMSGALSIVAPQQGLIANKTGYWGSEFYELYLARFVALRAVRVESTNMA